MLQISYLPVVAPCCWRTALALTWLGLSPALLPDFGSLPKQRGRSSATALCRAASFLPRVLENAQARTFQLKKKDLLIVSKFRRPSCKRKVPLLSLANPVVLGPSLDWCVLVLREEIGFDNWGQYWKRASLLQKGHLVEAPCIMKCHLLPTTLLQLPKKHKSQGSPFLGPWCRDPNAA